jgi:hypothetical protein
MIIFTRINIATDDWVEIESGRSFTNTRNSRGPKIEPWGTPDRTGRVWDDSPRTVTLGTG